MQGKWLRRRELVRMPTYLAPCGPQVAPALLACLLVTAVGCRNERYVVEQHSWHTSELIPEPIPISKRSTFGDTLVITESVAGDTTTISWIDPSDTSRWVREHPYTQRYIRIGSYRPLMLDCSTKVMVPSDSLEFLFCTDSLISLFTRWKAQADTPSKKLYGRGLRQLKRIKRQGSGKFFWDALAVISSDIPFNVTRGTDLSMVVASDFETGRSAGLVYHVINLRGDTAGYFTRTRWIQ